MVTTNEYKKLIYEFLDLIHKKNPYLLVTPICGRSFHFEYFL